MRQILIALLAGTIFAAPACAPNSPASAAGQWRTLAGDERDAAGADSLVARLLAAQHLLAIAVAVVQDSGIVYARVAGEVAPGVTADTSTVFRAASLGKPVFAYLALRLADEGLMALDSPVVRYLPRPLASYEHYAALAADPRHRALTVRRILSLRRAGTPPGGTARGPLAPGVRRAWGNSGEQLLSQ